MSENLSVFDNDRVFNMGVAEFQLMRDLKTQIVLVKSARLHNTAVFNMGRWTLGDVLVASNNLEHVRKIRGIGPASEDEFKEQVRNLPEYRRVIKYFEGRGFENGK